MTEVTIGTIVEGHGEVKAVPVLLRRLATLYASSVSLKVPPSIRLPRGKIVNRPDELDRAIEFTARKLGEADRSFILLLFDADSDCPAKLAPPLLEQAKKVRSDRSFGLTVAKSEYENWFIAGAESIRGKRGLSDSLERPEKPEEIRDAKAWLKRNSSAGAYSETLDQPALSAVFDIESARQHSASFDKFCRDFERLIAPWCSEGPQ